MSRAKPSQSAELDFAAETELVEHIAASIRDQIVKGNLVPGDRVPSERELAACFGVARSRARQALNQLRIEGYLVSGRGRAGTRVASLDDLASGWSFRGLLVEDAGHLADLMEFSLGVEVEAAGLAAARRLPEDLAALNQIVTSMAENRERFDPGLDIAFHLAVVQAAHNVFYASIVGELRKILHDNLPFILDTLYEDPSSASVLVDQHSAIAAAIRDRDVHRARDASSEHLQWAFREIYRIRSDHHDERMQSQVEPSP